MIQMLAESATFESSSDACVSSQLLQWTKTETKVKTTKNIYISWNKTSRKLHKTKYNKRLISSNLQGNVCHVFMITDKLLLDLSILILDKLCMNLICLIGIFFSFNQLYFFSNITSTYYMEIK